MRTFLLLLLAAPAVWAHGSVSWPPPRQAIDGTVAPWNGSVPEAIPFMFWCAVPDAEHPTDSRGVSGANGQACFWFNNGCDISCDECDGRTGQVVHPKFLWTGTGQAPDWEDPTHGIIPDPNHKPIDPGARPDDPKSQRLSICKQPKRNATICAPELRTINPNTPCHSETDFFQFAPWRAPGSAPVTDACGIAGGVLPGQGPAAAGGDYQPTKHAKRGDLGSKLPARPTGVTWTAGEEVEVAWVQKAWHGGGYQYRLCPADAALTEACFQSHPVPFADGTSKLRWAGKEPREELVFNATDVAVGTLPEGSTWRRGPFPRGPWEWYNWGASYNPVCNETEACKNAHVRPPTPPGHDRSEGTFPCKCSGSGDGDLYKVEIVDKLRLPSNLNPGEWVLGWRWDCEESTQVWNSCSDVTIKA